MKAFILILILFILQINLSGQNAAETGDAKYLYIIKTYALNSDGSIEFRQQSELKILSFFAIHRKYGETIIDYNPKFQDVIVNEVYTINSKGDKVLLPFNAVNEVLTPYAVDAPAYNHLRRKIITHTGLDVGSVIHADYTIITKSGFFPSLMGNERILQSCDADSLKIIVNVPTNTKMIYKLLNSEIQPVVSDKAENKTFTWNFTNIKSFEDEIKQPPAALFEPYLLFSTKDLKEVYNEFLNQKALSYYIDENLREWARKKHESAGSDEGFANIIHQFINNEVRTYPANLSLTGYKTQTADEVYYNCGGTKLEKLILMNALLQAEGIKAVIFLVARGFTEKCDAINLNTFTEAFLQVNFKDKEANYYKSYLPDEIIDDAIFNKTCLSVQLPLFVGMSTFDPQLTGTFNIQKSFSFTTSIDCDLNQLNESGNKIKADERLYFNKTREYISLHVPIFLESSDVINYSFLLPERNTPFMLPYTVSDTRQWKINIPKCLQIVKLPQNLSLKNNAGQINIKTVKKRRQLIVSKSILFDKQMISPEDYSDFRELYILWQSEYYNIIFLMKKEK